jgi:23S rRNA (cytidine1920-2'-O)/16S rRNA (cytidine1409-2'-O)-methyltransferase
VEGLGWRAAGLEFSPVTGPEGNVEFLLLIERRNGAPSSVDPARIELVVQAAYDKFMKSAE